MESLVFEFSLDASSLITGTWTPITAMNLVEPNPTLTTNAAQDGNLPTNRIAVSTPSPVPLAWADTTTMWIRWKDTDNSGGDALIALDDFSINVALGAAPKDLLWTPTSGVWDNAVTNWKDTVTTNIVAFSTGTGVLNMGVSITIVNGLTDKPTTISGNLSNGGATRKFILSDGAAVEDLILNANLTGGGRVDFDGTGAVRIAGDNSAFTGGLQFDTGPTYVLATSKALGTGQLFLNGGRIEAAVPLTGADKLTAPVSLGGSNVTFAGKDIEFGGVLTMFGSNSAKTLNVDTDVTLTFSGSLSGLNTTGTHAVNSNIIKAGPGKLVIAGTATGYGVTLTSTLPPAPEFDGGASGLAVVPELASGALLQGGLATLLGFRRRY